MRRTDARRKPHRTPPPRRGCPGAACSPARCWPESGGVAVGAAAGGATAWALSAAARTTVDDIVDLTASHPFYGRLIRAGSRPQPQRHCVFMTFRFTDSANRRASADAAGPVVGSAAVLQQASPSARCSPTARCSRRRTPARRSGSSPASLTVTVGLGPQVFDDRFGLAATPSPHCSPSCPAQRRRPGSQAHRRRPRRAGVRRRPAGLLPRGPQPGAARPQHRHPFWAVLGFGRASAGPGQQTPRNLMGFKDGTRNISDRRRLRRSSSGSSDGDQPWMDGGTYQVVRKIRMLMETWDTDRVGNQQRIFGRHKENGAPLTGNTEFDTPDFAARDADGRAGDRPAVAHRAGRAREQRRHHDPPPVATTTPTASTPTASSTPGCCSSRTRTIRATSSRCRTGSAPTTCSTSTSGTSAPRSSPFRRARRRATTSASRCSADAPVAARQIAVAGEPGRASRRGCRTPACARAGRRSPAAEPSSMPTSASPVSRLLRLTYSNSVMSSFGPSTVVEESAQRAGLLREVDQEVVLEAEVHQ